MGRVMSNDTTDLDIQTILNFSLLLGNFKILTFGNLSELIFKLTQSVPDPLYKKLLYGKDNKEVQLAVGTELLIVKHVILDNKFSFLVLVNSKICNNINDRFKFLLYPGLSISEHHIEPLYRAAYNEELPTDYKSHFCLKSISASSSTNLLSPKPDFQDQMYHELLKEIDFISNFISNNDPSDVTALQQSLILAKCFVEKVPESWISSFRNDYHRKEIWNFPSTIDWEPLLNTVVNINLPAGFKLFTLKVNKLSSNFRQASSCQIRNSFLKQKFMS
eukprot:NODE_3_length_80033_cov_0.932970.p31 type:complete len:276 gc:universal NODE_3_length_80033_cov_0.932970:51433-52260(+)